MNKEEAKEALIQASRIIDQWEKNELESYEAMELLAPLLKTITAHVENVDPAAGSSSDLNLEKAEDLETPGAEEDEAASFLPEEEKEKEKLQEGEEGDLFSKESEDLEEEKEDVDDESKSKKKRKEFAGSNGEIPF